MGAYSIFKVCMCQYGDAMQIQVQIGDNKRVFYESASRGFKKNYILREIPKTRFIDFGLLYENDKGEYVVLNDVRMVDIRLASIVYLLVYVSTYCVPITLLRQNKPFPITLFEPRPNN